MKPIFLLILSLITTSSSAYINAAFNRPQRSSNLPCSKVLGSQICLKERIDDSMFDDNNESDKSSNSYGNNDKDAAYFAQSLSQRITEVEQNESSFVAGIQKRMQSVAKSEEFDSAISDGSEKSMGHVVMELPVVCFDALLPKQRMTGSTTDETFCNLLRAIGLGGTFVMTSLNNRQRKIRRFGVVAKIELVDVDGDDDNENLFSPTAVSFSIAGRQRCEILGPGNGMKDRIGRWRRGYDPDCEESKLGWGEERFVDKSDQQQYLEMDTRESASGSASKDTEWSTNKVLIVHEATENAEATSDAIAKATYLIPLIEQWISLASDQTTYDNIDVVAGTRRRSGEPGLKVNASALIRKVRQELGPMPDPKFPISFAMWGAALINPLPALGVATEIRGAVLEAEGAERKLAVLERGLVKSINNLDGTRPLNM